MSNSETKWDYKKPSEELSKEFKAKYIIPIKGKDAILADGLKKLAHLKGIKSLKSNIVQFPNQENNNLCIVETELVGYDYNPITDKVEEVTYKAIGDASPNNCTSLVKPAFVRMAETRSIARVLKNYTNVGIVAVDELIETQDNNNNGYNNYNNYNNNYNNNGYNNNYNNGYNNNYNNGYNNNNNSNNNNGITQEQTLELKKIINDKHIPQNVLVYLLHKFKKKNFKDLSLKQAQAIIDQLNTASEKQIADLNEQIINEQKAKQNNQSNSQQAI